MSMMEMLNGPGSKQKQGRQDRSTIGELDGQMDRHEQSMKQSLDEAASGLAALVAEMDDKIDRALARNATETEGG